MSILYQYNNSKSEGPNAKGMTSVYLINFFNFLSPSVIMEAKSRDVLVLAPKHARSNVDEHGGQRWTIFGVILT